MRFFALDTGITDKARKRYCAEGEREVLLTRYHWMAFFFRTIRELLFTMALIALVTVAWTYDWPMTEIIVGAGALWVVFVFFYLLKVFIDWRYDMILLTTEKIVLIDQTSFLRHEEKPMHLENIGGVTSQTQLLDIFHFGRITLNLKEGLGGDAITLEYVPDAKRVAAQITDVVTKYQRKGHALETQRG